MSKRSRTINSQTVSTSDPVYKTTDQKLYMIQQIKNPTNQVDALLRVLKENHNNSIDNYEYMKHLLETIKTEIEYGYTQINLTNEKNRKLNTRIENLRENLDQCQQNNVKLLEQLEEVRKQKDEYDSLLEKYNELDAVYNNLRNEFNELVEFRNEIQGIFENYTETADNKKTNSELIDLIKKQINMFNENIETLRQNNSDLQAKLNEYENSAQLKNNEIKILEAALKKAQQENENYKKNRKSIEELIARTSELEDEIKYLNSQLRKKDGDSEIIQSELENKKEEYHKCSQTLNDIKADLLANKKTIDLLNLQLEEKNEQYRKIANSCEKYKYELTISNEQVHKLETQIAILETRKENEKNDSKYDLQLIEKITNQLTTANTDCKYKAEELQSVKEELAMLKKEMGRYRNSDKKYDNIMDKLNYNGQLYQHQINRIEELAKAREGPQKVIEHCEEKSKEIKIQKQKIQELTKIITEKAEACRLVPTSNLKKQELDRCNSILNELAQKNNTLDQEQQTLLQTIDTMSDKLNELSKKNLCIQTPGTN